MTVEIFLGLLAVMSVVTSLCTQAVKALLDSLKVKYASNIVALIVSIAVGIGGMGIFYELCNYVWSSENIAFVLLMVLANWLCAMLGYDKVMQAIKQIKE